MAYDFRVISLLELRETNITGKFPSNQTDWICHWFDVFKDVEDQTTGSRKQDCIVGAYQGNKLAAVVPLLKLNRSYAGIKIEFLEFLGQQWSNLGNDIWAAKELEGAFVDELASWLRKNIGYHFLFFKYLPKSTVLAQKFKLFHYAGAPYVQVSEYKDYGEFSQKTYSRRFREDLRRTLRRANRDGFEFTVKSEKITPSSLEKIKRIAKSKETDGKSFLYDNPAKEEFHLKVYSMFPSHVVFIELNGQPAAYGTCIDWNGERIGIDSAFDRNHRRYGLGIHCIDKIVRDSFRDQKQKLSFGLGLDIYKSQFTDKIDKFYMCFGFKFRLKSLLALPYFIYRVKREDSRVVKKLQDQRWIG